MVDLAELARRDHLPRQPHRRDEAVVERAHVLDAGRLHPLPGLVALVGVAAQRLLADHVLAGLGGGDRRLGVQVVGPGVVEQPDALVGDERAPVGHVVGEAVAARGLGHRLLVAPRDRHQLGRERRRPRHVGQLPVGVGMGLAHERVAEHADADRRGVAARRAGRPACGRPTRQASLANAASKATDDGGKSVRRRKRHRVGGAPLAVHAGVLPFDRQRPVVADPVQHAEAAPRSRRRRGRARRTSSRARPRRSRCASRGSSAARRPCTCESLTWTL